MRYKALKTLWHNKQKIMPNKIFESDEELDSSLAEKVEIKEEGYKPKTFKKFEVIEEEQENPAAKEISLMQYTNNELSAIISHEGYKMPKKHTKKNLVKTIKEGRAAKKEGVTDDESGSNQDEDA